MQISATWRIAVETLKNVDDSIKNYLVLPLNLLNEQFVNAFNQKQISTNDNTTSHVLTQTFISGTMLVINNPLNRAPIGVNAIGGGNATHYVTSIFLTPQSDQSKLGVTVIWSDSATGPCTFRLEGG